jgi:glucose 1-dehydrogenase
VLSEQIDPAAARQDILDIQPTRCLGTAQDISNGAIFFASEIASFISGHCLIIDGAFTATQIDWLRTQNQNYI